MNLLAHSHLGLDLDPLSNSVNIFWDLIGDDLLTDERPFIRHGAERHWQIDRLADQSEYIRQSMGLISPKRRRAASVLMDLFCDYLLAEHWHEFSDQSLDDHIQMIIGNFRDHSAHIGPPAPVYYERFDSLDWFHKYKTIDGLADVLSGMSRRSSPRVGRLLLGAEEELKRIKDDLKPGFVDFYRQMLNQMGSGA